MGFSVKIGGLKRNFGLDALRAAAIISVLLGHGTLLIPAKVHTVCNGLAVLGVELFFALSGFLIGNILFDIQKASASMWAIGVFWLRRWMRTLPLYYLMIAILALLPGRPLTDNIWLYLTLTQNLLSPIKDNWFAPSWSLVVEEWSYFILPLLAFGLLRKLRNPILFAAIFLCIAGFIARIVLTNSLDEWDVTIRKFALTRIDAIAYGVILSYICARFNPAIVKLWAKRLLPASLFILMTTWVIWVLFYQQTVDVPVWMRSIGHGVYGRIFMLPLTAAAICAILPLSFAWGLTVTAERPIRFIARISYALYLVHWPVLYFFKTPSYANFSAFIIISFAISAAISLLIEWPIMNLRPKI